jgi:hypothetical protein
MPKIWKRFHQGSEDGQQDRARQANQNESGQIEGKERIGQGKHRYFIKAKPPAKSSHHKRDAECDDSQYGHRTGR